MNRTDALFLHQNIEPQPKRLRLLEQLHPSYPQQLGYIDPIGSTILVNTLKPRPSPKCRALIL